MAALQNVYRPQNFDEVAGNTAAIESIQGLLKREIKDIPQTWLFYGPAGCGKTTLARIMRDELGCNESSFFEYNSANTRGIDTIRKISSDCRLSALNGDIKIYLIDECHMITGPAQEAFLKTLEDVPSDTFFFLCTTNPEKLLKPIRSRCTTIEVKSLSSRKVMEQLKWVCDEENIKWEEDEEFKKILNEISKNCGGALRDALKLLDIVMDMEDYDNMKKVIDTGLAETSDEIYSIFKELTAKQNAELKWKAIAPLLKGYTKDAEGARLQLLGLFRGRLLDTGSLTIAEMMESFEDNFYNSGLSGLTLACFQAAQVE